MEKGGAQEIAKQLPGLIPQDETEKKAFFDKFRREFKSSQDQARGPWTNPEPWTKIRKRMSEYSVRETLGRPTRMRPSVKPHVEVVYFYTGDLNSDGDPLKQNYVEFKDKRVVSFKCLGIKIRISCTEARIKTKELIFSQAYGSACYKLKFLQKSVNEGVVD